MLRTVNGPRTRPPSQPGLPELPMGLTLGRHLTHVYFWSMSATGAAVIALGMPSLRAEPSGITLPSLVPIQ
jgi:hypothetical protein